MSKQIEGLMKVYHNKEMNVVNLCFDDRTVSIDTHDLQKALLESETTKPVEVDVTHIFVERESDDNSPAATMSVSRLKRIVREAVDNALKHPEIVIDWRVVEKCKEDMKSAGPKLHHYFTKDDWRLLALCNKAKELCQPIDINTAMAYVAKTKGK